MPKYLASQDGGHQFTHLVWEGVLLMSFLSLHITPYPQIQQITMLTSDGELRLLLSVNTRIVN